jgi:hypothetical protein
MSSGAGWAALSSDRVPVTRSSRPSTAVTKLSSPKWPASTSSTTAAVSSSDRPPRRALRYAASATLASSVACRPWPIPSKTATCSVSPSRL